MIDRTARQRSSTRERSATRSKAREAAHQSESKTRDSWLTEWSMSRTVWTAVLLLFSAILLVMHPLEHYSSPRPSTSTLHVRAPLVISPPSVTDDFCVKQGRSDCMWSWKWSQSSYFRLTSLSASTYLLCCRMAGVMLSGSSIQSIRTSTIHVRNSRKI